MAKADKTKVVYSEPDDYIPDEIQRKNKVGKYAELPSKEETEKRELNKKFRDYVNGK